MKTSTADFWFSRYIRLRDSDGNGCARCCTCGAYKPVKRMDCGHYIKRQHMATRFDERNCACQCKKCNAFEQGNDKIFADYIEKRYGLPILDQLRMAAMTRRKYSRYELSQVAEYFKQKAILKAREKNLKLW